MTYLGSASQPALLFVTNVLRILPTRPPKHSLECCMLLTCFQEMYGDVCAVSGHHFFIPFAQNDLLIRNQPSLSSVE